MLKNAQSCHELPRSDLIWLDPGANLSHATPQVTDAEDVDDDEEDDDVEYINLGDKLVSRVGLCHSVTVKMLESSGCQCPPSAVQALVIPDDPG